MVRAESRLERLPDNLLHEIFAKLDVESLCCAAPVSRTLHFSVSYTLSFLRTIDFSGFSPDRRILDHVLRGNKVLSSLTLDCWQLDDSSLYIFAKEHLQELILLRCSHFTTYIFTAIGEKCHNLRSLRLEIVTHAVHESPRIFKKRFTEMLKQSSNLEILSLKFLDREGYQDDYESILHFLPETIKVLQFRPTYEQNINHFILDPISFRLESLSLVLDIITDKLLISITHNIHLLVKLDLEDRPRGDPPLHHDLTNRGLQSLGCCTRLTHLSLVRRREYYSATFKRVNDMGLFLLVESCNKLESVKLGGFSKVTDAGFVSILRSCEGLKKFEVINAFFLSDLAFHDLGDTSCSLVNVRLASCSLVTSETAESLSLCRGLDMLDLWGCKSVADQGLRPISSLTKLTSLNLGGSDITDNGLMVLGHGNSPITSLFLRNCKRVTDRGVAYLLLGGGIITETLSIFDLGFIAGISDKSILTIIEVGVEITDLCVRNCFNVTDASIEALSLNNGSDTGRKLLRRLDLCNCSLNTTRMLDWTLFRGLHWLGVGGTFLSQNKLLRTRTTLAICFNGCEMGCPDGCSNFLEQ